MKNYGIHNPSVGFARSGPTAFGLTILTYSTKAEAEQAATERNEAQARMLTGTWTAHRFTAAQKRALVLSNGKSVARW
jgi:hypothetical protein